MNHENLRFAKNDQTAEMILPLLVTSKVVRENLSFCYQFTIKRNFPTETYAQTENLGHTSCSYVLLCCFTFPNLKSIIVGGRNTHTAITRQCNVGDFCEVITGPLLLHVWTSHSPHSYTFIPRCRDGSRSVRKYCHTTET